ncbi:integration host factor subunit beta [Ostreibacterium oceani]|uniref:Integration host factor subunit beta n=1 Tax=Ostreibacterium oceani TaxID=2654998 RepID=A0A6N7F0A3_9GAMM|nr:integration host factor subunit beta [Ostreibacterium oceani]MPV86208.1 integration host factor subunit beta [Ostreibacterium oceani]
MTKLELIENLTIRFDHWKNKDVKEAVYTTFEEICHTLESGNRVEIRGFGSFSLHHRDARIGRNPKTGEKVQVEAKAIPYFRAGKEMRERINDSYGNTAIKK